MKNLASPILTAGLLGIARHPAGRYHVLNNLQWKLEIEEVMTDVPVINIYWERSIVN